MKREFELCLWKVESTVFGARHQRLFSVTFAIDPYPLFRGSSAKGVRQKEHGESSDTYARENSEKTEVNYDDIF